MELINFYAEDGAILSGYINKCGKNTNQVLIETHGMGSNCLKTRENVIAKEVEKINIDTICFNNRGNGTVNYIKFKDGRRELAGTAFENIEECYYDFLGAIKFAISLGYNEIYLQGHSLGASKILYTYNKMKEENCEYIKNIKAILLLSFVDVSAVFRKFSTPNAIEYANKKKEENKEQELMPYNAFLSPISVKNYLKYIEVKNEVNEYKKLKVVDIPLFMRWGNVHELIEKKADEHAEFVKKMINNAKTDISYIDGANHSYEGKEKELAKEVMNFLENI